MEDLHAYVEESLSIADIIIWTELVADPDYDGNRELRMLAAMTGYLDGWRSLDGSAQEDWAKVAELFARAILGRDREGSNLLGEDE